MKKILLFSMLVMMSLLVVAGCSKKADQPIPQPLPVEQPPQLTEPEPEQVMAKNIVEITPSGFVPKTITVKAGDTVTWVNKDSARRWPATDLHPVHMTYPGSNIKNCGTVEESSMFDACKGLEEGEEYSFTFAGVGRWPYHDHLKPNLGGVVVVQS